MYPELIRIGGVAIHTYGFMMTLAFALGIAMAIYRGKKYDIDSGTIWDLAIVVILSSLLGSRALYVITHLNEFQGNWFAIINPIQPDGRIGIAGMVLLGGVVTATIAAIIFIRKRDMDVWALADVIAPVLAVGISLGRIGCFCTGCCYGQPTDSPLGIVFPHDSHAGSHFPNTPVLPTQLFASGFCFLLAVSLIIIERWKKFHGFTFSLFLIGYSIFRIWIDTIRVYDAGDILINTATLRITVSQSIAAGMIVFGVGLFVVLRKKQIDSSGMRA
ncbi:prolipoprotein diacylglyceryl transferase [candidate division LCP-89 bacterium B3_LCP]|uniref:Phosphatidylglycerol--prolipoprotein diacylglyceryl transferase n=1 Tax=candidate division LCP-89 bacterium B3_LCP TaxID=2012998 RepID=A0A532V3M0_UNCL8|nr:MAG: prolipoprotein diacylglyceryl transferase [candidate division LCP-89 bacterium B3_LCP]